MVVKNSILILIFAAIFSVYAQNNKEISVLKNYYRSFEYQELINKADSLLNQKEQLSDDNIIDIYTLKAASHYNIGDMLNSRKTFIEILKSNRDYTLDDQLYSPKMLEYFVNIKEEFNEIASIDQTGADPIENKQLLKTDQQMVPSKTILKSLLLPGLGHFDVKKSTQGWILTAASCVTLGSMFYYIADAHQKEEDYLIEKDPLLIQSSYDKYNKSYKLRNSLIIAYAAIWLYSQIDLLFFSDTNKTYSPQLSVSAYRNTFSKSSDFIEFSFTFQF